MPARTARHCWICRRRPGPPPGNGAATGTLLLDGQSQGEWSIIKGPDQAILQVRPYVRLDAAGQDAVAAEGAALLAFAAPGAAYDVRLTARPG
ncbi:MAG: hypothetical protein WAK82_12110 [Streptosporangiaceae bacterium]